MQQILSFAATTATSTRFFHKGNYLLRAHVTRIERLKSAARIRIYVTASRPGVDSEDPIKKEQQSEGSHKATALDAATLHAARSGGNKVVVLAGLTGIGKSSTSLELARLLDGEIINADSVQMYRGLDVGSAKLTLEEREGVPHHLMDVLDPDANFSAGEFCDAAWDLIHQVLGRGKVPIVVGGTGMYLQWMVKGRPTTPPRSSQVRLQAEQAVDLAIATAQASRDTTSSSSSPLSPEERWEAALGALRAAGASSTADTLLPNDYYRLKRALEITLDSGLPQEAFQSPIPGRTSHPEKRSLKAAPAFDFRCFFLYGPRIPLYRRLDLRCEQMVEGGLLRESAWMMRDLGLEPNSCPAVRAIGYRQAMDYLEKSMHSKAALEENFLPFLTDFQTATRQYTTRQLTWFRTDEDYLWKNMKGINSKCAALDIVKELSRNSHEPSIGDGGRLTKDQEKAVRRYRPELKLFSDQKIKSSVVETILSSERSSA